MKVQVDETNLYFSTMNPSSSLSNRLQLEEYTLIFFKFLKQTELPFV